MMRRIATAIAVFVVATVLALLAAWGTLLHNPWQQGIANGPWRTSLVTGSTGADMYTRAYVAITGLFALNPSEAVYFSASIDDAGRPLLARCSYRVEGRPVPARWWSITAYSDDHFLIPNAINRFSYNMGNLDVSDGKRFSITAAPIEQPGNWLPTGTNGNGFTLLFRLYNATPETIASLSTLSLPSISRVGECP